MGVKFKCRLSGNVFEFEQEYDIRDMREHPQYTEIEDETLQEEEQDSKEKVKRTRKAKDNK